MLVWVSLVLLLVVPIVYIGVPTVLKYCLRFRFLVSTRKGGAVHLTFDDGPDPRLTPEILDILQQAGVKATFFVLGENVQRYPELTRRIADLGHEIGEHSYRHFHAWKTGPVSTLRQLTWGAKAVQPYRRDHQRVLFRPPFGKLNLATLFFVWIGKRSSAFWDVDPRDYEGPNVEEVIRRAVPRIRPGCVILMHDGRTTGTGHPEITAQLTRRVISEVKSRNLVFATLRGAGSPRRG